MKTFIAVKDKSKRCPDKNIKLLPNLLNKVSSYLDITILTDSPRILNKYQNSVFEDSNISELHSVYNYIKNTDIKEFIILPVTQPFIDNQTIMNVAFTDLQDYDLITTYTMVPDRSIFILNEDNSFKYNSYERKGSICKDVKMVDGSIYKMSSAFLNRCINSENVYNYFWNKSKIKFIENKSDMFLDVDTPKELKIYEKITSNR